MSIIYIVPLLYLYKANIVGFTGTHDWVLEMLHCFFHLLLLFFFFKVSNVVLFPLLWQGYGEGPHYNEHEGLSSPFISAGVAGMFQNHIL